MEIASRYARPGDFPKSSSVFPKLQMLDLGNPAAYVEFFGEALNFAFFPDAARPGQVANGTCGAPQGAWSWIEYQRKERLSGPERACLEVLDSTIATFSLVLR